MIGATVAIALGAVAVALVYRAPLLQVLAPVHEATAPSQVSPSPPAAHTQAAAPAPPAAPRFDIVRIAPDGQAVIAGRAEPGATVAIQDQGKTVGEAQADAQGNWVFIPPTPLAAGPRELTLTERAPGGASIAGTGSVLLVVPPGPAAPTPAMAVLATPNAAPRVLQSPGVRTPGKLALDALDYGQGGDVRLGGTAPAGSTVRVYVDNAPVGEARTGTDGTWSLTPQKPVAPGMHKLRLDQVGATGKVIARVQVPFSREAVPKAALAAGSVVVQPGNSLWRFARQAYGAGVRYTIIYQANREEIRDPRWIYPGQVLSIPPAAP
jgi:nucleoid-associated protein YgaU